MTIHRYAAYVSPWTTRGWSLVKGMMADRREHQGARRTHENPRLRQKRLVEGACRAGRAFSDAGRPILEDAE